MNWVIFFRVVNDFLPRAVKSPEIQTEWKCESITDRFRKIILEDGVYD